MKREENVDWYKTSFTASLNFNEVSVKVMALLKLQDTIELAN